MRVGEDTYITSAEADDIINGYLVSTDPQRVAWAALSTSDKEVYLRQALQRIDALPLSGRPTDMFNLLQFPRKGQATVPGQVKQAQALEACASIGTAEEADKRAQLQAQGITAFSAGSLSESYGKPGSAVDRLFSAQAKTLLKPFLLGVVPFD